MEILSTGRSGSTLLEVLLAAHPDVVSAGELLLLGHLLDDPEARCSCGDRLRTCPFWTEVFDQVEVPVEPFRETRDAGRVLRWRWLLPVLTGRTPPRLRREVAPAAKQTGALVSAIARVAGRPIVVDASKDTYRLHALRTMGTPMAIIHLTRDPRGFTCSITGASTRSPGWLGVIRAALRWSVQEVLMRAVCRAARQTCVVHHVRYEDLASDAVGTLNGIGRRLGLRPGGPGLVAFMGNGHALAGNPMRARTEPIALDERWRTDLTPAQQTLVWVLTAPLARSLGYSRRVPRVEAAR